MSQSPDSSVAKAWAALTRHSSWAAGLDTSVITPGLAGSSGAKLPPSCASEFAGASPLGNITGGFGMTYWHLSPYRTLPPSQSSTLHTRCSMSVWELSKSLKTVRSAPPARSSKVVGVTTKVRSTSSPVKVNRSQREFRSQGPRVGKVEAMR
eukprot:scaffold1239_cov175-Pinguiococcus_pyrenoidosus.AAC.8